MTPWAIIVIDTYMNAHGFLKTDNGHVYEVTVNHESDGTVNDVRTKLLQEVPGLDLDLDTTEIVDAIVSGDSTTVGFEDKTEALFWAEGRYKKAA